MQFIQSNTSLSINASAGTVGTINLTGAESMSIIAQTTAFPSIVPATFTSANVNTTTNTVNVNSHGYFTGLTGNFESSDSSALPSALTNGDNFAIIVVDSNHFQLVDNTSGLIWNGSSTPIANLSDVGTGNIVFTPNLPAIYGQLMVSNDGTNYAPYSMAVGNLVNDEVQQFTINGTGNQLVVDISQPTFVYAKVALTPTLISNYYTATLRVALKTNNVL